MGLLHLPSSLLALAILTTTDAISDRLPYNPTRIFTSLDLNSAYIFELSPQNSTASVLSALDLRRTVSANLLSSITSTITTPFLPNDASQGYTPFIDTSGNLTVVTGSCSLGAQTTEIWRYAPRYPTPNNGGTWTRINASSQQGSVVGATNFLANGATFSPDVNGDEADNQFYIFGGMCPFANSTRETWTSAAEYSGSMVSLTAKTSGESVTGYEVGVVPSTGGPIPEAGFSMTGLAPTYSTNLNGQPKTMQQDFLLIGGQTQTAFINMSSVAVYSLPQQSWIFLPVQQPVGVKTDLAIRQSGTVVEPRSGHTAVLSEDGGSVIVYGGWVGDVTNPATPQLAVLTLGSGYGGNGEGQTWSWSVPQQSGSGPPVGSGIYGHGATILPGGIMMIAGGYTISTSSSKHKRAAIANQNFFLYNTTSNSWLSSYSPNDRVSASNDHSHSGALSTTGQRIGLGVGLGVGLLLLIAIILLYIWYTRRLKRKRKEREARLTARPVIRSIVPLRPPYLDGGGIDGRGGDYAAVEAYSPERNRVPSGGYVPAPQMEQAGSTGLFVDIPSPTRGLRKGSSARPYTYHAAPRYDDGRPGRGSNIHPIVEQEDEDDHHELGEAVVGASLMSESERKLREVEKVLNSGPEQRMSQRHSIHTPSPTISNPFADPSSSPNPLGSHPVFSFDNDVTPGGTVRRIPTIVSRDPEESPSRRPLLVNTEEAFNWIAFQDSEEATEHHPTEYQVVEHPDGRVSPAKTDDRTSSTLSDRSHASTTSITRTMSTRTGAILSAAFAAWRAADNPESSPREERSNPMSHHSDERSRSQLSSRTRSRSNTLETSYLTSMPNAGKSTDSFMTARTSFVALQSEGESLLGGARRDDPYQRAMAAQSSSSTKIHNVAARTVGITTVPVPPPSRGKGFMGSLRRALTAMSGSERTNSMLTSSSTSHEDSDPTSSSSAGGGGAAGTRSQHTRNQSGGAAPRRTVSDGGAALLSHKRGKRDWDPDAGSAANNDWGEPREGFHDNDNDDENYGPADEREWDVEGEANKRDVQIMFTIPKTRLRVVNADVERASMRSASDGQISRAGSTRSDTAGGGGGGGGGGVVRGRGSLRSLRRGEKTSERDIRGGMMMGLGLGSTREEEGEGGDQVLGSGLQQRRQQQQHQEQQQQGQEESVGRERQREVLIPGLGEEEKEDEEGEVRDKGKRKAA